MHLFIFKVIGILLFLVSEICCQQSCRCLSGDTCFPNLDIWQSFNNTVDGHLISLKPFSAACHDPNYNQEECEIIVKNSTNGFWRVDQPSAMIVDNWLAYMGQQCLPTLNHTTPCYQGSVPVYAVDAQNIGHVQKAVVFAGQYNLRLVVKTSGHDYSGRSTARGSLLIWTHHLKEFTFQPNFKPDGCPNNVPQAAVTLGVGLSWMEAYPIADAYNITLVGGSGQTVSTGGGFMQGGGHSILSPTFGLAADNVLQIEVVLANGEAVITNECQEPDLFWALRGGGGGTFGVVTAVTYKTHPKVPMTTVYLFIQTNNADNYWKIVENFLESQPSFSDNNFAGYHYITPSLILVVYASPISNISIAYSTFMPFINYAKSFDGVMVNDTFAPIPSFWVWYQLVVLPGGDSGGGNTFLGSRLLERSVFDNSQILAQTFRDIIATDNLYSSLIIIGHLVAGGAVSKSYNNSVNPAWRTALVHYVIGLTFVDISFESEAANHVELTTNLLRMLTPQSGAYINEADTNEPDWQHSFFGTNYPRLLQLKQKYDSNGLFYCTKCVGSEFWSNDGNCRISH